MSRKQSKSKLALAAARVVGPGMSVRRAARAFGISHWQVYKAMHILADTPHLVSEIEAGRMTLHQASGAHHRVTVSLPSEVFDRLCALRDATSVDIASQIRAAVDEFLNHEVGVTPIADRDAHQK